jgi:hypothetical protein
MRPFYLSAVAFFTFTASQTTVFAEPAAPAPLTVTAQRPPRDLGGGVEAWIGPSFTNSLHRSNDLHDWGVGGSLGVLPSLRWRLLRVGALVEASTFVFTGQAINTGLVIGPSWQPLPALRLELLAEGGLHSFFGIGGGLFVDSTSGETSAELPYAGVRASIAWRFGKEHRGILGGWFSFRDDLMRRTASPTVTTCLFGCSSERESWNVGGESFTLGIRVGFES